MSIKLDQRSAHEIEHGRYLAQQGAEDIWGWESTVGRIRAKRRSDLIIESAKLATGKRVLEVGCGTGIFSERFAATGASLTALDISAELLSIARQRELPAAQVRFVEGRFEDCSLDTQFDCIIGSSVLHHLDMPMAVARAYSLLKPNGILCFAEPNMLNPQIALQKNIPWLKARMGDSPHEKAILKWPFKKLLSRSGFTDIAITPFDWLHPIVPTTCIPAVSSIGMLLERIPLIKEFAGSVLISARRPHAS